MPNIYKDINNNGTTTLDDYLSMCTNDEQRQKLFFSMDLSMKKLHDSNYYIRSFNANDILVYEGNKNLDIYYKSVDNGCDNFYKKQNIFYLTCFVIGVYSDCLRYMNPKKPDFLISNFDEFAQFIPSDDVPYYKGIVMRGSSVYYSDFIKAKRQREFGNVQAMSNSSSIEGGTALTKSTLIGRMNASDDFDQKAFISVLLFPVIIMVLGFIVPFLIVLFS